ncbi:MAG: T9SS type A sorting domain-containing protein [Bacteroidales bacterium]|nr:T9SS type A sorting domain-containing protein [Bacteroidales bacterium]
MKRLILIALLLGLTLSAHSQNADSVDILRYDIAVDLGHSQPNTIVGTADITLRLLRPCTTISLLLEGTADTIALDGQVLDCQLDNIGTANLAAGDTAHLHIAYHASGYVENYGWGGFHFDNDLYYNLGVAFDDSPHSIARAWFPTRDNFTDKALYSLRVTTKPGWSAQCGGLLTAESHNPDGSTTSEWALDHPTPPYLVSVAAAQWNTIERNVRGRETSYPATFAYISQDSATVSNTFALLDTVLPAYEHAFGPYIWQRIGYCATHLGSMEHVMNIALAEQAIGDMSETAQFGTVSHELGHAWFGNTITCAESGDMWINEGGASFCEEVAIEACRGHQAAIDYYQTTLEQVLRLAHVTDGAYRSLHDMPHAHTYGTTTYKQGSLAWHSLRGLLGDSLFYQTMNQLFTRNRYANFDAYALRDTLSAISSTDLTAFFDNYVFTPGFFNYHIDSVGYANHEATVRVSRQRIGYQAEIEIPSTIEVSLFDWDFGHHDVQLDFVGDTAVATFAIPFEPVFWAVDYNHRDADAATNAEFVTTTGITDYHLTHFGVRVYDSTEAHLLVEHHWGQPGGTNQEGIVRTARRYWVVNGTLPWEANIAGRFHYAESGYGTLTYRELDEGFYWSQQSIDSMALLYRHSPAEPWTVATRHHSNNLMQGFYTDPHLRTGEYILAVIDTNILATAPSPEAGNNKLLIAPNPNGGELRAIFDGEPSTLTISDIHGRTVLRQTGYRSGSPLSHNLPAGSYIVKIKNNFLSLQSQLIVL